MALHAPSKFQDIENVLAIDTGKEKTEANSTDHPNSPKEEADGKESLLDPAFADATQRVFQVKLGNQFEVRSSKTITKFLFIKGKVKPKILIFIRLYTYKRQLLTFDWKML